MQCRHEWDTEFVRTHMSKSFMSVSYKKHREEILLEREKSLLPSAQVELEHLNKIDAKVEEIRKLQEEMNLLKERIEFEGTQLHKMKFMDTVNQQSRREFIRQCPNTQCKGFLSTQWKCGLCKSDVCKDCREIKNDGHSCEPSILETVKLLQKDTKPCPGCGVEIFSLGGCSQYWCTQCHTAFNWNTGRVETGLIHNPHFYEWQREEAFRDTRAPGELDCNANMVSLERLPLFFRGDREISSLHRFLRHLYYVEIPKLATHQFNPQADMDLRIEYLRQTLDEKQWKVLLHRREKKRSKERMLRHLYTTYINMSLVILNNGEPKQKLFEQIEQLNRNVTEEIARINSLFGSRIPISNFTIKK